jgi:hypothetical protein
LKLTIDDDYDFHTNKLIPQPDLTHPMKKSTTAMFAFSESSWEPRVAFHLEKGIPKLKERDWDNIMKAAAEYSNFMQVNKPNSKKSRIVATEEELELSWGSDSDAKQEI